MSDGSVQPKGWARLWATARPYARPMPRAGAWYPVVGEASRERAVIEVAGKRVAVPKTSLEIREDRPKSFTVVARSRETAATYAAIHGETIPRIYAVCPRCGERIRVLPDQAMATCSQCQHHGEIAWWETG